jgi:uncharacterized OB-fold protein
MGELQKTAEETKQPRQFNGPVYRCNKCGVLYNTVDYKCPGCERDGRIEALVELGLAAATMDTENAEITEDAEGTEATEKII